MRTYLKILLGLAIFFALAAIFMWLGTIIAWEPRTYLWCALGCFTVALLLLIGYGGKNTQ